MTSQPASAPQSILDLPILSRIRRNHGLEHATLHVLARRFPRQMMAGYSDPFGFWIIANVPTETLQEAIEEALSRMKNGEHQLALHPNCGTNFITAGLLAGTAGAAAMLGVGRRWQDKLERLPMAAVLATLALIIAQPLGLLLQANLTTSGHPGSLEVLEISSQHQGRLVLHRVRTRR